MTTVCVGDGLNVDVDGKLVVDICDNSGLKFTDGCLAVDERTLHHARVCNSNDVTIPAAATDVTRTLTLQTLTVLENVGGMPAGAGGLTVVNSGRYTLSLTLGDNPSSDNTYGDVVIGIGLLVNGVQAAGARVTRGAGQTHILSCTVTRNLVAGDRIQAQFNIHGVGTATVPHDILAGDGYELGATQLPTQYVGTVA